jgi:NADH-quinone oxidoreductase subunit M
VLAVIYILRMVQDSLFGEARKEHHLWDVKPREILILALMALPVLYVGLHPGPILRLFDSAIGVMLLQVPSLAQNFGG